MRTAYRRHFAALGRVFLYEPAKAAVLILVPFAPATLGASESARDAWLWPLGGCGAPLLLWLLAPLTWRAATGMWEQ